MNIRKSLIANQGRSGKVQWRENHFSVPTDDQAIVTIVARFEFAPAFLAASDGPPWECDSSGSELGRKQRRDVLWPRVWSKSWW